MQSCSRPNTSLVVSTPPADTLGGTLDSAGAKSSAEPESCCPQPSVGDGLLSGWTVVPQQSRKAKNVPVVKHQECDHPGKRPSDTKSQNRKNKKRRRKIMRRDAAISESETIREPSLDITSVAGSAVASAESGPVPRTTNESLQTNWSELTGSKRSRLDDAQGANKKPTLKESRTVQTAKYADAMKDDQIVAITSDTPTGQLNQAQADHILTALQPLLQQEALNFKEGDNRILFRGKPTFSGGVLKLWCDDTGTLEWLKKAVQKVALPSGDRICVKRLTDVQKAVRCGILLPGVWKEIKAVGLQLQYHNEWAQVDRWSLLRSEVQESETFIVVSIPEDLVSTVMEHNRRLGFFFGSVYIKFQGPKGKFTEWPPMWDKPTVDSVSTSAATDSNTASQPNTITEIE
ncbi:uncharacterized protein LOC119839312 isoform X2 [Zerene cesonia]|uniref:uncharacterized protein LOC119839312 isoform X2 n=1 Tax=Zerene cesonia TaxID=33412 RepID=UPI0018E5A6B0|nr:uncharacterized protein LOC119839312 isoform X2 [Zerene cesonia]